MAARLEPMKPLNLNNPNLYLYTLRHRCRPHPQFVSGPRPSVPTVRIGDADMYSAAVEELASDSQ